MSSNDMSTESLVTVKATYLWKIKNFSADCAEVGEALESPLFSSNCHKWQLMLYPSGIYREHKGYLSVYLKSCNATSVQVKYAISILNEDGETFVTSEHEMSTFDHIGSYSGDHRFLKQEILLDKSKKLLMRGGKFKILCEIYVNTSDVVVRSDDEKCVTLAPNRLDKFEKMLNNLQYSDVKFVVGGREFHAHKNMLVANSKVFEAMFKHEMKENSGNTVEIEDIDYSVFKEMFRFVYCGKVREIEKIARELLIAAEKYQIEDLKVMCEDSLGKTIRVDNAIEYLSLADMFNADGLKRQAIRFIKEHGEEMIEKAEFETVLQLNRTVIMQMFRSLICKEEE